MPAPTLPPQPCHFCGYDLAGLAEQGLTGRCLECGKASDLRPPLAAHLYTLHAVTLIPSAISVIVGIVLLRSGSIASAATCLLVGVVPMVWILRLPDGRSRIQPWTAETYVRFMVLLLPWVAVGGLALLLTAIARAGRGGFFPLP